MAEAEIKDGGDRSKSRKRRRRRHSRRSFLSFSRADRKWLWLGAAIPVLAVTIGVGLAELNRAPPAPLIDTRPPVASVPMVTCPGVDEGVAPLVRAAACGDREGLKAALSGGAKPDETDSRLRFAGRTALHHAAQRRSPEIVDQLLAAGASSNATDAAGNTPLHLIVHARHHRSDDAVARLLLRSGADVHLRNSRHLTPLEELELDHSQLVYRQALAHVLIGRERELGPEQYSSGDDAYAGLALADGTYGDAERADADPAQARQQTEAIRTALRLAMAGWAEAWSKRDSVAYLGHYAEDFTPPDGQSPDLWREARRDELRRSEKIALRLSKMDIRIDGNQAQVHFTQDLEQGGQRSSERRTLVFGKRNGEWLIISEHSGA